MKLYILWHVYALVDDYGEHDEEKLGSIHPAKKHRRPFKAIRIWKDSGICHWSALKSTKLNWIGQVGMTALRQLAMWNKSTG